MKIIDFNVTGYGKLQLINDKKTAIVDCGMPFNGEEILSIIRNELEGKPLDYILLTHSHFDHIGCISLLKKTYPNAIVVASEKTANVFKRDNAKKLMRKLSDDMSMFFFERPCSEYDDSLLSVDCIVKENDTINLGESNFIVVPSKGHTDCSIAFYEPDMKILFASESTGSWIGHFPLELELCKSYYDAFDTAQRLRNLEIDSLYLPHSGLLTDISPKEYFSLAKEFIVFYKSIIVDGITSGKSDDEVAMICKKEIFDEIEENGYPMDSIDRWMVNTKAFIAAIHREFSI